MADSCWFLQVYCTRGKRYHRSFLNYGNWEVIFYSGNSNVNEMRLFTFIDEEPEKGLSGVDVEARFQE